jgi:hypothetical protein
MLRQTLGMMRELPRLQEIASVFIRHGLGDFVQRIGIAGVLERAGQILHRSPVAEQVTLDPAQRMRMALEELGHQVLERLRRHLGVQLLELGDPARRKQIHARRHHLAELDEGRAELLERHAHALRGIERDLLGDRIAVQDLPGALQHPGDADALHEFAQAVADEDRGDFLQARQLAHHADGVPQHGPG